MNFGLRQTDRERNIIFGRIAASSLFIQRTPPIIAMIVYKQS